MENKYRILYLEDSPSDAELVQNELNKGLIQFDYLVVDTEKGYVKSLDGFFPDVILCDHTLPGFNSFEALRILKAKKLNIPFIVITATMTEDVAMTIVREGAADYILKDHLKRLPHAVINAIEKYRFENERKKFIDEAYEKEASSKRTLVNLSNKILLATKTAHVGIWEYIIETNKFNADAVMSTLYGIKYPGFNGRYDSWLQYIHPEDITRIRTQFQNELIINTEFNIEFRIIHPDKSLHYIEGSAIVERDTDGKALRIIGTNLDVTARKKAEQALQVNSNNREIHISELISSVKSLNQFTYMTSHNLRAPLSNLISLLNLIDYSSLTEANREITEMFKISVLKLDKTINDVLQSVIIKNNGNVSINSNNIDEILDDVCSLLAYDIIQADCVINRNLEVKTINFNKSYMESILTNLLSNAIKYRSPNRSLQIDVSITQKPGGEVLMIIKDNGQGLDLVKNRDKIFGLYQRFHTNTDSVGLGLFIVKSQITALGGHIEVESEIDKGTSFNITFKQKQFVEVYGTFSDFSSLPILQGATN